MLSKNIVWELNQQIGNEFGMNHLYTVVSNYFSQEGYPFLSKYFRKRAKVKMKTGRALADHVARNGGEITLQFEHEKKYVRNMDFSAADIFNKALGLEESIADRLGRIYDLAMLEEEGETAQLVDSLLQKSRKVNQKMAVTLQQLKEYDEEKHFIYMEGMQPKLSRSMAPYLREPVTEPPPHNWMIIPRRT